MDNKLLKDWFKSALIVAVGWLTGLIVGGFLIGLFIK